MKCKNCSANYKARELKCPYCDTTNLLGHIWLSEKTEAELEYEKTKREYGGISKYVVYRVLTRVLVLEVVVGILIFLGVVAYFFLEETFTSVSFKMNKDKIEVKMEEAWKSEDYDRLDAIMDKYNIDGQDYYIYTQATIIHSDYERFTEARLGFLMLSEEEKQSREYEIESSLEKAYDLLAVDFGLYDELAKENEAQYERVKAEVEAYLRGTLGMTQEEYRTFAETEYLSYSDIAVWRENLLKREAWR